MGLAQANKTLQAMRYVQANPPGPGDDSPSSRRMYRKLLESDPAKFAEMILRAEEKRSRDASDKRKHKITELRLKTGNTKGRPSSVVKAAQEQMDEEEAVENAERKIAGARAIIGAADIPEPDKVSVNQLQIIDQLLGDYESGAASC